MHNIVKLLGSEVKHIYSQSRVGARIDFEKILLSKTTIKSAKKLCLGPYDFAFYEGWDFELVFALCKNNTPLLKKEFEDFRVVGQILEKKEEIYILKNNQKTEVKEGYNHSL
ncbi:MAG: hypothetical protein DRN66_03810 [Candidatus Nanohalarchaeota archaeon]|nr:MAG: hypothetical protein DRN66_03810 [Candidatus Nanohaloarchaeota archaeon]